MTLQFLPLTIYCKVFFPCSWMCEFNFSFSVFCVVFCSVMHKNIKDNFIYHWILVQLCSKYVSLDVTNTWISLNWSQINTIWIQFLSHDLICTKSNILLWNKLSYVHVRICTEIFLTSVIGCSDHPSFLPSHGIWVRELSYHAHRQAHSAVP